MVGNSEMLHNLFNFYQKPDISYNRVRSTRLDCHTNLMFHPIF
jgi:hypothetical protein